KRALTRRHSARIAATRLLISAGALAYCCSACSVASPVTKSTEVSQSISHSIRSTASERSAPTNPNLNFLFWAAIVPEASPVHRIRLTDGKVFKKTFSYPGTGAVGLAVDSKQNLYEAFENSTGEETGFATF